MVEPVTGILMGLQTVVVIGGGFLTSLSDIKSGKILNSHVLIIATAGGLLGAITAWGSDVMVMWISSGILSLSLPALFWWKGFIPAGDAKLLMAMGLAVPLWWYPPGAPALFPFSLILILALGMLAVPIIFSALRKATPSSRSDTRPDTIDGTKDGTKDDTKGNETLHHLSQRAAQPQSVIQPSFSSRTLFTCLATYGKDIASSLVFSWLFLIAWQAWVLSMKSHAVPTSISSWIPWIGALALLAGYGFILLCAQVSISSYLALGAILGEGWLFMHWGGSWIWLAASVIGSLMMIWFNHTIITRVHQRTKRKVSRSFVHTGDVMVDARTAEGLSPEEARQVRNGTGEVWIWDEVRFAKTLFIAVLIVGAVSAIINTPGVVSIPALTFGGGV